MHPISAGIQRRRRRKLSHHHSSHHGHHNHHHGGVRTVELRRGRGGFGFTISGQRPCILSCIVPGSPAERAGLRPGDHLISVNGRSVARAPHDDVVRLVGASAPLLTLKVAETYYFSPSSDTSASETEAVSPVASSSSSDADDGEMREKSLRNDGLVKICGAMGGRIPPPDRSYVRPRPPRLRHIHKPRTRSSGGARGAGGRSPSAARVISSAQSTPARAARVVQDLRTGAMFQEMATLWGQQNEDLCLPVPPSILMPPPAARPPLRKERKERRCVSIPRHRERLPYALLENEVDAQNEEVDVSGSGLNLDISRKGEAVNGPPYKAVVGYLGSIEMPEEGRRMQVVRGCIRRMRAERRAHAVVLLSVQSGRRRRRCVEVSSASGSTLASYPADRIAALCACGDARFFGLVVTTSPTSGEGDRLHPPCLPLTGRSSCHVFAVEPGLRPHTSHAAHARAFGIGCTGGCIAFPDSAIPVLQAIASICGGSVSKGNNSGSASGTDDIDSPGMPNRRRKIHVENNRTSLGDLLLFVDPSVPPALASVTPSLSSGGGRHPSSTSSNSDSGIGFRDERGAMALDVSDREAAMPHCSQKANVSSNCPCASGGRLTVRAMPDPVIVGQFPDVSDSNAKEEERAKECPETWVVESSVCPIPKPSSSSSLSSFGQRPLQPSETVVDDPLLSYKLSPKVYGLPAPPAISDRVKSPVSARDERRRRRRMKCAREQGMTHSLEDIKGRGIPQFEGMTRESLLNRVGQGSLECISDWSITSKNAPAHQNHVSGGLWGSLQDLRCLDPMVSSQQFISQNERNLQEGDLSDLEQLSHQPLKKWSNATGFRRTFGGRPRFVNYLTASDDDVYKQVQLLEEGSAKGDAVMAPPPPPPPPLSEERGVDVGRVGGWATSFEKLLDDPIGLHTFAEFLKKEFSAENIYFWVACERYRITADDGSKNADGISRRASMAQDIFQRHLCPCAPEPVNVDSHARQETEEGLAAAEPTLFLQAQKQIFNLMKFDSYPRFLKSDLYKECLMRDMSGQSLSFATLDADLCLHHEEALTGKLKKSRSDAEERRRKSLLPWHRKNRSKSKDRGETDYQKMRALLPNSRADDASSSRSDLASSRSSLASSDLALIQRGALARQSLTSSEWSAERIGSEAPCPLCRVVLPDGATTVVNTDTLQSSSNQKQSSRQSIRDLVTRLLEKRGLKYSAFEVFFCDNSSDSSGKPLDLDEDIQVLGSREVRVERRVIFRVDLPSRKTIGVKSNPDRSLAQVLRPILHKYGYPLESVALCLMSENEVLDPSMPVTSADNEKIQVLTKSGEVWKTENGAKSGRQTGAPTLDEITNRVFEELLAGKVAEEKASSRLCNDEIVSTSEDRASVRSEDWSSEHSSGIFGRFLRSDSAIMDKSRDSRSIKGKKGSMKKMKQSSSNDGSGGLPAVIRAIGNDFSVSSRIIPPAPRLKTGIRPPGRSDSDELYEGLKRAQRSRLEDQRGTEINFELPDFLKDKENAPQNTKKSRKVRREDEQRFTFEAVDLGPKSPSRPLTSSAAFVSRLLDCTDGITPRQAERYFSTKTSLLPRCVSLPSTETTCGEDKCCDSLNISVVKSDGEESSKDGDIGVREEKDIKETVQLPESLMESQSKNENCVISKSPFPISKPETSGLACPLRSLQRPDPPVPPPPRNNSDPPPLPPKPKNLPVSSKVAMRCKGWGTVNPTFCHSSGDEGPEKPQESASKREPRICRSRRAVYLDQPSSSFV